MTGVIVIEGHVQGLSNTRSFGMNKIPVWVIDTENCITRYSRFCNKFIICPGFNTQAFIDFLCELSNQYNLNDWMLLPSNDHAVHNISKNLNTLEKYFKVITPRIEIIDKIYNKTTLIEIAKSIGVPVPKTYDLENIDLKKIEYPILIKGVQGLSFYKQFKQKVILISDSEELKNILNSLSKKISKEKVFIQELIPYVEENKTTSFAAFCINGEIKTYWMGVKLREHPVRFGTAIMAKSVKIDELYITSFKLLKEIEYTGICEIEYLKDPNDGEYKLIEINPRTWLWVGLAIKNGINFPKFAFDYVNGLSIPEYKDYPENTYWQNPITNFVYSMQGIITGKLNLNEYIKTIFIKKENALFSNYDPIPGLVYLFKILSFYKRR